ncbi:invasion associated locus B family protein [Pseudohoeflea suaedae]|uniref:invasion associated locus B family protein n=1 Tax=Pseudohoeflea suaedae TaxID=877384 RepID=UPI001304C6A6|nr:invasion associated locus B family protein [Pseudohoeflea suaedae]
MPTTLRAEDSNGASAITEVHGDWTVSCRQAKGRAKDATDSAAKTLCTMSQQQVTDKRQHVISMELRLLDGQLRGALVMPFGLALAAGTSLQIDKAESMGPLPFSTCLPAGCIVPVVVTSAQLAALRSGQQLSVNATALSKQPVLLSISLKGFAATYDRLTALAAE